MESNLSSDVGKRYVLPDPSTVENPDARTFLSTFQSSQFHLPSHSSSSSHPMALNDGKVQELVNPFSIGSGLTMSQPNMDNQGLQPLTYNPQQGSTMPFPSVSSNVTLDALSKQIMMAGMAALQQQLGLGESNAQSLNCILNPNNMPVTLGNSIQSSVPDGSGLMRYRAPEIESFIYDRNTGYRFDTASGLHYDANTGFFINVALKIFMRWDPITNTYLREVPRSGPLQNAGAVSIKSALPTLNNHSTLSTSQPIPVTISADMIQTLNPNQRSDALLLNQAGASTQDGNFKMAISAVEGTPQNNSLKPELWQQMKHFEKEVEHSKIYQKSVVPKDKNDRSESKRKNRSISEESSDSTTSHGVRESPARRKRRRSRSGSSTRRSKGGHRRSRSASRNRRVRSISREASSKRSRRSHSRESRIKQRRGIKRSRSRDRRRSHSQSPVRRSRSVTPQQGHGSKRERNSRTETERKGAQKKVDPKSHSKPVETALDSSDHKNPATMRASTSREKQQQDLVGCSKCGTMGHYKEDCAATGNVASGSGVNSSAYHKVSHIERAKKAKFNKQGQSGQTRTYKMEFKCCVKCGMNGHTKAHCTVDGRFCYNCYKVTNDHVASTCPEPQRPRKQKFPPKQKNQFIELSAPRTKFAQLRCFKCGSNKHTKDYCQVKGTLCYFCNKVVDHVAAKCPLRLQSQGQTGEEVTVDKSLVDYSSDSDN